MMIENIQSGGNESAINWDRPTWKDKHGKSFIFDEKGRPRLVQFRAEREMDGDVYFAVETGYPARDLEFGRPFGYSSLEHGPSVLISVPKSFLGKDPYNAARFELLDVIEDMYIKDLKEGQQGIARLVKQFTEDAEVCRRLGAYDTRAGQTATYFQEELQDFVDTYVKTRQNLVTQEKPFNGFDKLPGRDKATVVRIQRWAKANNIRDSRGRPLSFNSKKEDFTAEFKRLFAEAKEYGYAPRNATRSVLKPVSQMGQANTVGMDMA